MADKNSIKQRYSVYFSGDVQGVGFRYTTLRVAGRFLVTGYVRNLSDGRVELVAEGDTNEVARFVETVGAEMGGSISRVEEKVTEAEGGFRGFNISYSLE